MLLILLALACQPALPDCEPGQNINADYECVDDPAIPGSELLPPCDLLPVGDEIEVSSGCSEGACADATYDSFNAALGETGECDSLEGYAFCDWRDGLLGSFFDDNDGDDVPDDGAGAAGVFLDSGYAGASADGLGVDISLQCWIDVYGYTDLVEYETVGEEQFIAELQWGDLGLIVDAQADGDGEGDGLVDGIALFGYH